MSKRTVAETNIEKKFGAAIKKWREKIRLSQDDLGQRTGLHRPHIFDIERGSRNVSLRNVQKLSDGLGIPLPALFASLTPRSAASPMTADEQVDILVVEDSAKDIELTLAAFKNGGIANRLYVVHDGATALDFLFGTG